MQLKYYYLIIVGPTCSGKSQLALSLAKKFSVEVVSCDSIQIYKSFDIGSAKPSRKELNEIPHHMISVATFHDLYDADRYAREARLKIIEIKKRNHLPIVVGGTGLYLRALRGENWDDDCPKDEKLRESLEKLDDDALYQELKKLNPERAKEIHPHDRFRLIRGIEVASNVSINIKNEKNKTEENVYVIKVLPERKWLHEQIAKRVEAMIKSGLVDEVKNILQSGCEKNVRPMQSIGYKQVVQMLDGEIKESELAEKILFATRQYAKRQYTWFKKVEAQLAVEHIEEVDLEKLSQEILCS